MQLIGSFESTYQPLHDVDVAENTGHVARWRQDLELMLSCGVTSLRYPIRWHRIEERPGTYDWRHTDLVLGWIREQGMTPIADLVHHTSYPRWLEGGFADPAYGPAVLRYYEAFAERYPWIPAYTLFNEPFTTLFMCGSEGIFPPYWRGIEGFIALCRSVLPPLTAASRMYRELLPGARHVHVDTCERHSAAGAAAESYAAYANDRRFFLTDILVGAAIEPTRPFVAHICSTGGADLLEIRGGHVDLLGLDYYAHSQWQFIADGVGAGSSPHPARLDDLILEYWERYRLPLILAETNIRGRPSDRATWFKYTLEHCESARRRGAAVEGYCWFPFIDSCDWSSLLRHADRDIDPVGVFWLDAGLNRRESAMSRSFRIAAAGGTSADLPAYRLAPPVADWVGGYAGQMKHWVWQDAPDEPACTNQPTHGDVIRFEARRRLPEPPPGSAYAE